MLRKETKELWQFFSGMFVGTWCGISLMCLVQVNRLHVMDVQRYDAAVRLFEQTVKDITEAVILPEKNQQERTDRCEKRGQ